jgi:hypothetical protein
VIPSFATLEQALAQVPAVMAHEEHASSAAGFAARRPATVSCWMCGIRLQQNQMVPDGGSACGNIRWYCKDTRACTERWTSARRQARAAGGASERSAIAARLPGPRSPRHGPPRRSQPAPTTPHHQDLPAPALPLRPGHRRHLRPELLLIRCDRSKPCRRRRRRSGGQV